MSEIELVFPGSQYCRKVSNGIIPHRVSKGRTTIPATRFVGGFLNNRHHLFWYRLELTPLLMALQMQSHGIFTFLPYRLYGSEYGGMIDGVRLRHKGHKYGFDGGIARVVVYQPRPSFYRKVKLTCRPWCLYFIYQFEYFYAMFELEERLYIPHQLLPIVRTPR